MIVLCLTAPASVEPSTASSPGLPTSSLNVPSSPTSPPPAVYIMISNETDLAKQIARTTSPTILVLPSNLTLTMALPLITGPLQLQSVGSTSIRCTSPGFTALTSVSESFSMRGVRWTGCGKVLMLQKAHSGADSNISISNCIFHANGVEPAMVSHTKISKAMVNCEL